VKAAWRDRYGGPSVVSVRDIPTPEPYGAQVLVRVRAASVNRADLDELYPKWAMLRLAYGIRAPRGHRIGKDVAGTVEAIGPDVARFHRGDEVFTDLYAALRTGEGAFAEYVCVPETVLESIPAGMTHEQAACLPHSAVLAIQSLRTRSGKRVGSGTRVLIVGASGNVGPFAIQISKAWGAHVTAVASGAKLDFVRSLGADEVIDYQLTDYTHASERWDWIVDMEARHWLTRWPRILTRGGRYLTLGASMSWLLSSLVLSPVLRLATGRPMGLMLWWKPFNPADVEELKQMSVDGTLKPVIERTYPLDQVAEALRLVDEGRSQGKVVVIP
jgi:NADPH:quinone reductase-like Zn-dependent oxidoreductase